MTQPPKHKILVVDDEPDLCEIICFELNDIGYETIVAGSANEAKKVLEKDEVDLIISDIRMPDGNGIELLEFVKKRHPEKPGVLFVTGFTDVSLEEAYDKGAEAIFTKPIDFPRLVRVVKESLMPRDTRWSRKHARVDARMDVELTLPGMQAARQSNTLNISRGGMFICLKEGFPAMNSTVRFRILFRDRKWTPLVGTAVVKWVRKESSPEVPSGIGIEFVELEPDTVGQLVNILNEIRTHAWIPKK